jgi:hypothetical protein
MSRREIPQNKTGVVKLSRHQRRDINFRASGSHPLQIFRPKRLAELFDIDESTVALWRRQGVLPEPAFKCGKIVGWTADQLAALFKTEQGDV